MGREGLMFVFAKEEMFKKEILIRLIPSSSTILDTVLLAGGVGDYPVSRLSLL